MMEEFYHILDNFKVFSECFSALFSWVKILEINKWIIWHILLSFTSRSLALNQDFFRAGVFFLESRYLDKHYPTTREKKNPAEKASNSLAWKLLKISFQMKNFTNRWPQSEYFFSKLRHFLIFEKGQGRPPALLPSSCAPGPGKAN